MEVNVEYAKENNRHELAEGSGTDASKFQTHLGPATATAADIPRGSTDTLRSLDITHNIPKVIVPMDSEESPWGGLSALGYILPNVLSERLICYFRCPLAIKFQRKPHKSWGKRTARSGFNILLAFPANDSSIVSYRSKIKAARCHSLRSFYSQIPSQ